MDRDDVAFRGQSDYTPLLLNLYDPLVLGPVARFIWRCPTTALVKRYRERIRPTHLDIGPGTGYFLEHAGLPRGSRVTIVDPNPNVLRHAARRLADLDVTTIEADVLEPLPVTGGFESAALHLVLHCLPGPLERKGVAVANVAAVVAPTGVLFGASVLGTSGPHSWPARGVLSAFNRRGAFDNLADTEQGLRGVLEASFATVELETIGSIAIFAASGPKQVP
jgi:SAM-dependent methyltransferase